MTNQTEFKIGDPVTFKAYEKAIPAIVKKVITDAKFLNGDLDDRTHYQLIPDTTKTKQSLVSTCTGEVIVESKYYKPNPDYLPETYANLLIPTACCDDGTFNIWDTYQGKPIEVDRDSNGLWFGTFDDKKVTVKTTTRALARTYLIEWIRDNR